MSAEDSLAGRWQRCERYYRDLWCRHSTYYPCSRATRVYGGMREFVERIAPVAITENIYPWNAHAWLILQRSEHFRVRRLVYLLCDEHGRFGIRWHKDGHPVMYTVQAMDSARWQRIVAWLDIREPTET